MTNTANCHIDVEALRRDHPVARVIGTYGIELKPGGRSLVGRCPFHADGGRPNLHVYPATESWYCFRCDVGGDVIEFVRRKENLGFLDACERLGALRAARDGPPGKLKGKDRERRWDRLTLEEQVVMNTAGAIYQHSLRREPQALEYLRQRGIPDWVVHQCALGYADGHSLDSCLRRRSGLGIAQELGLLRKAVRDDGARPLREPLVGRIVVPEIRGGHTIWFIGRDIQDAENRPKYLTLPGERPVLGLQRVAGRRVAYLCEGVFDYLTAISWRLAAFSLCGTHLPSERLGFLARAEVIYGILDGDEAGRAAAKRFGKQLGTRWRPIALPEGCDLNDLGRLPGGRVEFFRLLAAGRGTRGKEASNGC